MTPRAVLITIAPQEGRSGPQRLQTQRLAARTALRKCAERCGAPFEGWQQDDHRVPMPNGRFHWSISHHRTCAAAVIADRPIGIDVERVTPRRTNLFAEIAQPDEWGSVGGESWPSFFRIWTAKEATLKANGVGIGRLDRCRIARVLDERRLVATYDDREWMIEHFLRQDLIAALAATDWGADWMVIEGATTIDLFDKCDPS